VPKVGRNAPCPCGSGKKYKQCCWARDQEADLDDAITLPAFTRRADGTWDAHLHTLHAPRAVTRDMVEGSAGRCDWCDHPVERAWSSAEDSDGALLVVDDGAVLHSALVHVDEMDAIAAAFRESRADALERLHALGRQHPDNPPLAEEVRDLAEMLHGKEVVLNRTFWGVREDAPHEEE